MIGYGLAKAAVHHLTKSLAEEKSGLPENSSVIAILPITLNTEMNRKWMPNADQGTWTPLDFVAEYVTALATHCSCLILKNHKSLFQNFCKMDRWK